jgi:RHS repeat-associated protein
VADVTYNLRYPGQVADAESGLHYNYFRTYDPNTGRYTQPDPIGLSGDWNRYLYAGGSATNETDPTGLIRSSVEAACMKDPSFCMEIMGEMAGNAGEASRRAGDDCAADAFEQIAGALSTAGAIFEFAGMRGLGKGMARSAAKGPGKKAAGGAGRGSDYDPGATGPGKGFGGGAGGGGAGGGGGAKELPDSALVCRGGECKAENFLKGSGVTRAADGTLSGVSTQSRAGASVDELAKPFKNNQVGVTTAGDIRRAGGRVTPDGHPGNPNHATVDGLTAQQLEKLFSPARPNPVPPARRGF